MVKTYESRFPPSPSLDKVAVSFDKLINTDFFNSMALYSVLQAVIHKIKHNINWLQNWG